MSSALKAAFSKTNTLKPEGTNSSLYIGRLIDYPWLSQYLAVTAHKDPAWDKKRGKPVALGINKYVSISSPEKEITAEIEEAFAASGYRVISTTVEKVLVGGFGAVTLWQEKWPRKIAYDAMVWFRLKKD